MVTPLVPAPVLTGAPARDDFSALQRDVCGRFESDAFFADLPVIQEFTGTAENDAAEALGTTGRLRKGGKAGACVIVHEAERTPENPNVPGPQYLCEILVRVIELPKINRAANGTGKDARLIGQYVEQLFHGWQRGPTDLTVARSEPYSDPESGAVGRDVTLRVAKALGELPKCRAPRLALVNGSLTATCATPGAVIRHTGDGSFPGASAPVFPAPPVVVVPGVTVRAVAYAAGMAASNLVEWTAPAA